ncbi:MAG: exodeoxyribonuclease VII small subunit [Coriobacteriales bacterium]|jgi:exodeoxyribonuclease VII small subunit|nr:exodeoxyribonuclease VII small subunit [Coriobacteriales bacterium]
MDNQSSYGRARERLEEIVAQVRAKDISLEKSLDLYEEALRLGSTCAEMIDRTDFSVEELEAVARASADSDVEDADDAGDVEGAEDTQGVEDTNDEVSDDDAADTAGAEDTEDADDAVVGDDLVDER